MMIAFQKNFPPLQIFMLMKAFLHAIENMLLLVGIPKFLPSFPGMLLEKEVSNLKKLITNANYSSAVAVFGGSKVSTKIKVIEYYLKKFGKVIIGGAMANTFLSSKKIEYWCFSL